jgi:hypothetical protein
MSSRAWILVVCLAWMAYQAQFSPSFFFHMVGASLVDMQSGIDSALAKDIDRDDQQAQQGWTTAMVQLQ